MTGKNVGDLLNQKEVTWGWFQGGFIPSARKPDGTAVCATSHTTVAGFTSADYAQRSDDAEPTGRPWPSGTSVDRNPVRGRAANAYVQVSNRGLQPSLNVRVIALWADATAGLPVLPPDFWTTTIVQARRHDLVPPLARTFAHGA